jgi:hypothetical protein
MSKKNDPFKNDPFGGSSNSPLFNQRSTTLGSLAYNPFYDKSGDDNMNPLFDPHSKPSPSVSAKKAGPNKAQAKPNEKPSEKTVERAAERSMESTFSPSSVSPASPPSAHAQAQNKPDRPSSVAVTVAYARVSRGDTKNEKFLR